MDEEVVAESVASEPINDDLSLAEHETAFGAPPSTTLSEEEKVAADTTRTRLRHRAQSQTATPDDVAAINGLTEREKKAIAASGIQKQAGESERVYRLRARAELMERGSKPLVQAAPPAREDRSLGTSAAAPAASDGERTSQPAAQTRPKPIEDEVGVGLKYPLYGDYIEDLTDWKSEQREAARQQQEQQRQQSESQQRQQAEWNTSYQTFQDRLAPFIATHDDYQSLIDANKDLSMPPAAYAAILRHDNGPGFMYHLLQHPDQLAEMLTLWDGKPPTEFHVANATRWLSSRAQAVSTGSAAPTPPSTPAPRPPNPVRTGPMKTGTDLPGDDSSLAEHERAYAPKRR